MGTLGLYSGPQEGGQARFFWGLSHSISFRVINCQSLDAVFQVAGLQTASRLCSEDRETETEAELGNGRSCQSQEQ
jgi:hypothetical protein